MRIQVLAITLLTVLAPTACTVPNDSSIRLLNAHALTTGVASSGTCAAQTIGIYRGSLDLAGNTRYILQFEVESTLQSIVTTVPPDTVANQSRNEFVAKRMVLNYSSIPSLPFQPEQVDMYWVVQPNTSTGNFLQVSLLAPQARQLLLSSIQAGQSVELLVTMQVFGELASGEKVSTNKVSYPITVYRSGFTACRSSTDVRAPTGPCGDVGGQDGTIVGCCREILPTPTGCPT